MTPSSTLKACDFLEGNGNLVAVFEGSLPCPSKGYLRMCADEREIEIRQGALTVAKFPMPDPRVFNALTKMTEIPAMECPEGYCPNVITNVLYVQTRHMRPS